MLKHAGEYFAYATGTAADGRVFPIIRSSDLVEWSDAGSAMDVLPSAPPHYWAPEVTYDNGKFYLYYSCGNETTMHLRVAIAENPLGPFIDAGKVLTPEDGFAIDAHVFTDEDGSRYMFYATDFLDHSHIGTGTVVDRMNGWLELAGDPRPVTRAMYDWQVYDPNRAEKGGVRWHTVEGPAVIKRKGKYFEMFSGGNWQNTSYGVSFAVADVVDAPAEWQQFSDGLEVLPILRTIPDSVIGPGHNCIVRGPNNRELYCVYHRWTDAGRVMAIDRMDIAGDRIFVVGPTDEPQPAPLEPRTEAVRSSGDRTRSDGRVVSGRDGGSRRTYDVGGDFLCEATFRFAESGESDAAFSFDLARSGAPAATVKIRPGDRTLTLNCAAHAESLSALLPDDFEFGSEHLLRIELDHRTLRVRLDAAAAAIECVIDPQPDTLGFVTNNARVELAAVEITDGFEDLFTSPASLEAAGWTPLGTAPDVALIEDKMLSLAAGDGEAAICRGGAFEAADYAATLKAETVPAGTFGLALVTDAGDVACRFVCGADGTFISVGTDMHKITGPTRFDPGTFHQYRFLRTGGVICAWIDGVKVLEAETADARPARLAIFARGCNVFADAARVMAIRRGQ